MPNTQITDFELNFLRETISAEQLAAKKAQQYAQAATDPQLKELLQLVANRSSQAVQQLGAYVQ